MEGSIFPKPSTIYVTMAFAALGVWKLIEIVIWFVRHITWS